MEGDQVNAQEERGVVFIHGAGLRQWIWEPVIPHLDVPGFAAWFPGRTDDDGTKGLGLGDYAGHVSRQIEDELFEQVVLVGHSIGGVVGLKVASELPGGVAGFVGLSAAIPESGGSFLSCLPLHKRVLMGVIMRLVGTKPPDTVIRNSLCQGVSEAQADRVVEEFTPESRGLYTDRCDAGVPDAPSLYIETTEDEELPVSMQETMAANLRASSVVTVDAGHLSMLTHPEEVATALNEFTQGL